MFVSPRASAAYLAMLSMRTGGDVIPIASLNAFVNPCAATTESPQDSIYVASLAFFTFIVVTLTPSSNGERTSSALAVVPHPLYATNKHPGDAVGISVAPLGIFSLGMFGHPRTPPVTSPSSIRANAIAYCRPLMNPFVPSIGSKIQKAPLAPPSDVPRSMASITSISLSGASIKPDNVSFTTAVTLARRSAPASKRISAAFSSATRPTSGTSFANTYAITACAAKSATVTGESSLFETCSDVVKLD
mmetsp:Transcript_3153/g.10607  ORF Transcript_3153/g.10607 Transcript_3153/m.10607 type:complete len:247 (+) Transcript_3153:278-1018(+)